MDIPTGFHDTPLGMAAPRPVSHSGVPAAGGSGWCPGFIGSHPGEVMAEMPTISLCWTTVAIPWVHRPMRGLSTDLLWPVPTPSRRERRILRRSGCQTAMGAENNTGSRLLRGGPYPWMTGSWRFIPGRARQVRRPVRSLSAGEWRRGRTMPSRRPFQKHSVNDLMAEFNEVPINPGRTHSESVRNCWSIRTSGMKL